jgi:hypothetical protein
MSRYLVTGETALFLNMEVEASSMEEAIEIAQNEGVSLTTFAGNGGTDRLVGTTEDISLYPSDEIEWTEAEQIE